MKLREKNRTFTRRSSGQTRFARYLDQEYNSFAKVLSSRKEIAVLQSFSVWKCFLLIYLEATVATSPTNIELKVFIEKNFKNSSK